MCLWPTRGIKSLITFKYKVAHQSCVIYEGQCFCNLSYIGETKKNSGFRWKEHKYPAGKSEPG